MPDPNVLVGIIAAATYTVAVVRIVQKLERWRFDRCARGLHVLLSGQGRHSCRCGYRSRERLRRLHGPNANRRTPN